jgi:hypothetical protein
MSAHVSVLCAAAAVCLVLACGDGETGGGDDDDDDDDGGVSLGTGGTGNTGAFGVGNDGNGVGNSGNTGTGNGTNGGGSGNAAGDGSGNAGGDPGADCFPACTELYLCGAANGYALCPGFEALPEFDFVDGCVSSCEQTPALAALVDPTNCPGTVNAVKSASLDFAQACEGF